MFDKALPQIGEKLVGGPRTWRGRRGVQSRRMPVFRFAAAKVSVELFGAEHVARGMTRAAMHEPLDEIGSVIQLGREHGVRLEFAALEKQQLPPRNQFAE